MTHELSGPISAMLSARLAYQEQWLAESLAALDAGPATSTGYRHHDPITDPAWPNITGPDPDDQPDAFPPYWGSEPTERDRAAIDAGNA